MTNQAHRQLEQLALDAHRHGLGWAAFWPRVAGDVARAEPHDPHRYHRLVRRLLALLTAGDGDGMFPPGTDPWDADDQADAVPVPADGATAARLQPGA